MIRSFERHLRAENLSPSTRLQYTGSAERFEAWLGERDLMAATRADVESWLVELHERQRPATVRYRYLGLRAFYDWLLDEGEIEASPFGPPGARRIRPPELPETAQDVVDVEAIARLFRLLDRHKRWRDAVVIAVLYDTGMRASELAGALSENVDLEAGTILLETTKGRRPRLVGIAPETSRYIDRYWRRPRRDERYLINGSRGRMTREGIYHVVSSCFAEIGVPNIGPHDLRHTSATHQVLSGEVSESGLMATMGWRSSAMVRRYTEQGRVEVALAEHRRASPMARLAERRGRG
jgi:integrase